MICHAFLANVEMTRQVKRQNPKIRYPYKEKRFYPLLWPKQAVCVEHGRVVLPMGRGRPSIVLKVSIPEDAGGCKIVWNDGHELHVSVPVKPAGEAPGAERATADLGQIHLAAVTTSTEEALVVSGAGHQGSQASVEYGVGRDGSQAIPLPERFPSLAETTMGAGQGQRPYRTAGARPTPQGYAKGSGILQTA